VEFGQQTENKSMARKPNGTGSFIIGNHTFGYNNDTPSATEDSDQASFSIYPNPAADQITVSYTEKADKPLEIFDLSGNKIRMLYLQQQQPISFQLPAGIYILQVGSVRKRLIVLPY
jgi:hypothetical protein